jgi:predicted nucleic acid-binding protein
VPDPEAFIDTNVLLYLLSADPDKAGRAEAVLRAGGLTDAQSLNEL